MVNESLYGLVKMKGSKYISEVMKHKYNCIKRVETNLKFFFLKEGFKHTFIYVANEVINY